MPGSAATCALDDGALVTPTSPSEKCELKVGELVMGKSWKPPLNMEVYSWKNQANHLLVGDLPATFEYRRVYGMGDITNQKRTYGFGI